jgi:hypothetical protein
MHPEAALDDLPSAARQRQSGVPRGLNRTNTVRNPDCATLSGRRGRP